jgi:hypothetical protein
VQDLSGHIGGVLAGQEQKARSNLVRLTGTAQRHVFSELRDFVCVEACGNKRCPNRSGRHRINANSLIGEAGRPKGSRNKLSGAFLQALADDFDANGKEVIERVRTERPHNYLKVCASVLPKRLENEDVTEHKDVREMTDAELEAIIWRAHATQ